MQTMSFPQRKDLARRTPPLAWISQFRTGHLRLERIVAQRGSAAEGAMAAGGSRATRKERDGRALRARLPPDDY
jgi:hypothetical protein